MCPQKFRVKFACFFGFNVSGIDDKFLPGILMTKILCCAVEKKCEITERTQKKRDECDGVLH